MQRPLCCMCFILTLTIISLSDIFLTHGTLPKVMLKIINCRNLRLFYFDEDNAICKITGCT